jgi:hypothetical protein
VRERLEAFRARRGYVMAHQGAMAAALPALQDVYPLIYKTLTLDLHHLSEFEREFVWLALLGAADEAIGTHHIHLFFQTGGTDRLAEAAFRLVAWSRGDLPVPGDTLATVLPGAGAAARLHRRQERAVGAVPRTAA